MRDIKFRTWDKRNKSMCEVNYINFFKCQYTNVGYRRQFVGKTIDDNSLLDENMSGTCALMQYTGLKDKNSVEIYEGDIVKGFIPEIANEPERIGIVKWGSYSWIIDFELPKKFIFSVGSIEPRKNLLGLLKAYNLLSNDIKKEYKLVLAGFKGWENEEIMNILLKK